MRHILLCLVVCIIGVYGSTTTVCPGVVCDNVAGVCVCGVGNVACVPCPSVTTKASIYAGYTMYIAPGGYLDASVTSRPGTCTGVDGSPLQWVHQPIYVPFSIESLCENVPVALEIVGGVEYGPAFTIASSSVTITGMSIQYSTSQDSVPSELQSQWINSTFMDDISIAISPLRLASMFSLGVATAPAYTNVTLSSISADSGIMVTTSACGSSDYMNIDGLNLDSISITKANGIGGYAVGMFYVTGTVFVGSGGVSLSLPSAPAYIATVDIAVYDTSGDSVSFVMGSSPRVAYVDQILPELAKCNIQTTGPAPAAVTNGANILIGVGVFCGALVVICVIVIAAECKRRASDAVHANKTAVGLAHSDIVNAGAGLLGRPN